VGLIEHYGVRRVILEGGRATAGADAMPDLPSIIADRS
jgi:hypothetical protein